MTKNSSSNGNSLQKLQTLSKSRFKILIDQIEMKISQPRRPSQYEECFINSSNIKSLLQQNQRSRMLHLYDKRSAPSDDCRRNEKKISVNLQFNKLFLTQKRRFLEHSPNQKDLLLTLPGINMESKTKVGFKKRDFFIDKESPRWRHNPQITEKLMMLTESNENQLFRSHKKSRYVQLQAKVFQKDKPKETKKMLAENNQNKQNNQIQSFKTIKTFNESSDQPPAAGRFSHNEQRVSLKKAKIKLDSLKQRTNHKIVKPPQPQESLFYKLKLNTLKLQGNYMPHFKQKFIKI